VISANVCEDGMCKPDGGCQVGNGGKKSIRISSNGGELQIPKKGNVDWYIKR
jgi:hypothetical protein